MRFPWGPALPAETPQLTIVLAHLMSTLDDPHHIQGYIQFIRAYAKYKQKADVHLVVLLPPRGSGPETVVGWGTLVDAYLTEPFTQDALLQMLARLRQETRAVS